MRPSRSAQPPNHAFNPDRYRRRCAPAERPVNLVLLGSAVETAVHEPISIAVEADSEHLDGLMRNRILRT